MQLLQVGFEDLKTVTRLSGYHSNLLLTSTLFSPDDVMGRRLYRRLPLKAVRPVESAPTAWMLGLDFIFILQDFCNEVFVWPSRTPFHKRKQERRSAPTCFSACFLLIFLLLLFIFSFLRSTSGLLQGRPLSE